MKKFRLNGIDPCYLVGDGQGDLQGGAGGTGDSTGGQSNLQGGNADFNFEEFKSTYGKNYADKGFMQELTTPEKMFEKIDNMESLIGKNHLYRVRVQLNRTGTIIGIELGLNLQTIMFLIIQIYQITLKTCIMMKYRVKLSRCFTMLV
ncbi:MAG: hypothetical protein L6V95_09905 [Candidatus Melainabacteria bacterium]|nr:MAG: hypothetical protein L6V95_09905 [Candidatus Melainabacteria bacterium]